MNYRKQIPCDCLCHKKEIKNCLGLFSKLKLFFRNLFVKLPKPIIDKHPLHFNLKSVKLYKKYTFTDDFIIRNFSNLNYKYLIKYQSLSESVMIKLFAFKCENNLNHMYIIGSCDSCLNIKLYEKLISKHQKLSEDFIGKYRAKVYWPYILKYQNLSNDFKSKIIL